LFGEDFAGVDVENAEIFRNYIQVFSEKNVTFVIVKHKQKLLEDIVNKLLELEWEAIKNLILQQ
jgi:Fe-S cluster assembly ATPase SufC